MELFKSFILGIIEGITEFLPISSTGHLLIANDLMSFKDEAEVFTVVIQFGAIVAAMWYFRNELISLARGILKNQKKDRLFFSRIVVGLLPAGIIGLVIELTVGIPNSITLVAFSLIIGGLILYVVEKWVDTLPIDSESHVDYELITFRKSLIIGFSQCLAIIPGVSRSGATIVSALLCRINRPTATAFSFYLSVPLIFAASVFILAKDYGEISHISGGWLALSVGTITAFVSAFFVVTWLLRYVQRHDFKPFAVYRIVLGVILLIFL